MRLAGHTGVCLGSHGRLRWQAQEPLHHPDRAADLEREPAGPQGAAQIIKKIAGSAEVSAAIDATAIGAPFPTG